MSNIFIFLFSYFSCFSFQFHTPHSNKKHMSNKLYQVSMVGISAIVVGLVGIHLCNKAEPGLTYDDMVSQIDDADRLHFVREYEEQFLRSNPDIQQQDRMRAVVRAYERSLQLKHVDEK
jgi:hypothetical protein